MPASRLVAVFVVVWALSFAGRSAAGSVQVVDPEPAEAHPPGPRIHLAMSLGSGYGWASGRPDAPSSSGVGYQGWSAASRYHLSPEIGAFVAPAFIVSVVVRHQFVAGTDEVVSPLPVGPCAGEGRCHSARSATAAFIRLTYLHGSAEARVRAYWGLGFGGGRIRHLARTTIPFCGPSGDQPCVEAIAGGPLWMAGHVGIRVRMVGPLAATASLATQAAPSGTHMVNYDVNIGLAAWF